ncbi:MAG: hypothetical protein Q8P89_04495 [bacterium]|nr:hypothetical protein [bacterium]
MSKEAFLTLTPQILENRLSRRRFLKLAVVVGGAALINQATGSNGDQEASAQPQVRSRLDVVPTKQSPQELSTANQQTSAQGPLLLDTIKEAAIFAAGTTVTDVVARKIGLPINPLSERGKKMIREKPVRALEESIIAAPIEEAIFRLAPNLLLNDSSHSGRWETGILASLVFAYVHNFQDNEKPGKYRFIRDKFPLSHFLMGGYFWKIIRERDFNHAVTAHVTANALIVSTRRLLYKIFPNKLEQPNQSWVIKDSGKER